MPVPMPKFGGPAELKCAKSLSKFRSWSPVQAVQGRISIVQRVGGDYRAVGNRYINNVHLLDFFQGMVKGKDGHFMIYSTLKN